MDPATTDRLEVAGLDELPALAWSLLRAGAASATDPLHTPALATAGAHGPSQRTVVLRLAAFDRRLVACHTDRRSAKIAELDADARAAWLFYDRARKLQLRLAGPVTVHVDDELADECWAAAAPHSRACYNSDDAPGVAVAEPPGAPSPPDHGEQARRARGHFAVLAGRVDWLYLSAAGHRRARIAWRDGRIDASWITP